jgi:hypothetical protein
MRVKVGDRVKFLNDIGSGEVTRIVDPSTALVQVDDGFEVPWLISDLVVDAGRYETEKEEEVEEVELPPASFSEKMEEESDQEPIEDEEIVLAFLPDERSAEFETYLINSSSYHFKYTISREQEGEQVLFHEGTLEAGIKINLGSYKPGNLNDIELYRVQGIFFNAGFFNHLPPLDMIITVSASEMYRSETRRENDYFLEKAVLFSLYDWRKPAAAHEMPKMEIDPEALKEAMFVKGDLKPEGTVKGRKVEVNADGPVEVDLHIELLMDNYKSLTNSEILDIQMTRFRSELENAIQKKNRKIVFIHGVGNGKLKHDIRRALDTEYKKLRYQDASFKEYGFGATMVIIH